MILRGWIVYFFIIARVAAQSSPHGAIQWKCTDCHSTNGWKEMIVPMKFDHSKTTYMLKGQHKLAECVDCHSSLKFVGTSKNCYSCHRKEFESAVMPNHVGSGFGTNCERCHSMEAQSWRNSFDHNKTDFALRGAHVSIACDQCHKSGTFRGISFQCYDCHQKEYLATTNPNHAVSQFSHDCLTCHSNLAWKPSTFNHASTGFPLLGAHSAVACASCHTNNVFKGLPSDCFSCHQNNFTSTVNPNHSTAQFSHECLTCHSTVAWKPSTFNHSNTTFPLVGAHSAVVCASCHTNGVYKGLPSDCFSCHQNNFNSTANPNHATAQFSHDCLTCHSTIAWKPSTFNHANTSFPLLGAHAAIVCSDCHKNGQYKGTASVCYDCHTTDFIGTTNPNHVTSQFSHDCLTCHSNVAWKPATFNHSTTSFPLAGAHVSALCTDCHKNGQYKGTSTDCYSCHQTNYSKTTNPAHVIANFPTACISCHNTTAWVPSTFNHALYFPIAAGDKHRPGRWTVCADCHTSSSNFKIFSCINCHEHSDKASVDRDHQGKSGYVYESNACFKCHPKGRS